MSSDPATEHTGSVSCPIVRHRRGVSKAVTDHVVEEFPVALVFNGISHAVMMATPLDLESFAVGFALTEGIVERTADIYDLEVLMYPDSAEVQLTIAQPAFLQLKDKRRSLAGRTGCGVCGIESIELLDLQPQKIARREGMSDVSPSAIEAAASELPDRQILMRETGGIHAAAWCKPDGSIVEVFEDVGRHNALDKLIGGLALRREDMQDGFVFLSSRASYELVRKTARMNIALLATISAPTSLAIDLAQRAGMRLLSFCREDGFVEYTANESSSPVRQAASMETVRTDAA
ncbi:formate dehydrogenase accessory sulfurtransferase FdhD [Pararobbsia alpina]|uniref:Sulfur carrier protein FdhD n=1 Tax=Pararobbsia alpina TaxID=621374 RepID=A0A6S7BS31_9BURK|nr:formate dehydrogenase accessory sulfurtransferase FdhD [Pararobbsia alpina]CAB3793295.1 Sulfur carrier protein FdhD [Pararobbsia alpina]